jgi:hypothetical protein
MGQHEKKSTCLSKSYRLVGLFYVKWKTPHHDLFVQFLNTWKITIDEQIFAPMYNKVVCIGRLAFTTKFNFFIGDLQLTICTKEPTNQALVDIMIKSRAHVGNEQWNVSKTTHPYKIQFVALLHIIYQCE